MKETKPNDNPWRGLWIVTAMGAEIAVCVTAGYFLGRYVGGFFGNGVGWILGGIVIGLGVGGYGASRMIKSLTEDPHE